MKDCVISYLGQKGYKVNTNALSVIATCDNWYADRNIEHFHKRKNLNDAEVTLEHMGMAKRCCADDANLCEIVSVHPEEETAAAEFIDEVLTVNRFDVQYREQLERMTATGTAGAYIYLEGADYMEDANGNVTVRNGKVMVNYVEADCIIPLTVKNKEVIECAFGATDLIAGESRTTLVIFTIQNDRYMSETVLFDKNGNEIVEAHTTLQLGEIKPFAIMQVAEVNNIDNMTGYGLPKIYHNIPLFKACDLCFSILYGDLDKGQKIVFINELLATIDDESGKPILTPEQKEVFILLGEKLPDQDTVIKEYNPEIRIEAIEKAFELVLSLLSLKFGYGTRKYKFENGQIQTATEYIGEKQDELQELNKQRNQSVAYIRDILRAALWFNNNFSGTTYDVDEKLIVDFDDSYIENRAEKLENMRADAMQFPDVQEFMIRYIMEKLKVSREDALAMIDNTYNPEEERED